MPRLRQTLCLVAILLAAGCAPRPHAAAPRIAVTFPESLGAGPFDGRVIVVLATGNDKEPRFQVTAEFDGPQVFGADIAGWRPGEAVVIDTATFGFPVESLADVPTGTYWAQAVFHKYETFHLAGGHTVKLPMDRGEGQHWNRAPGNFVSTPVEVRVDPATSSTVTLALDSEIPPIAPPEDTAFVKHIRVPSKLLTDFWGRPMELGAHVLLPAGFDDHPDARYPIAIFHGHFPTDFGGFRTTPPDSQAPCEYSARFGLDCYNRIEQQEAYDFYQYWIASTTPRMLIVEIQHPTPYYDDSYAVNSAAQGPWGDAIMRELIPEIERRFRGLGQGWARFLYGGSTGGWEAMAAQVFYPDDFNGAFIACPDPIDFRAHMLVDIYKDANAYYRQGPFGRVARPGHRNWLGEVNYTIADENHLELVLGTKSRSGGQWDIWEATFSPLGADGYPKRLWDKRTGAIDPEVAAYWRDHYDLRHIMERDWASLGPKLAGKLHIYVGDMDNYYLNDAVYLTEVFLKATDDPPYGGEVDYGDRAEHCWNGDHERPNAVSRLRYNRMYVDKIMARIEATAPAGADLASWRY